MVFLALFRGRFTPDLRRESAEILAGHEGFHGLALGGMALGEPQAQRLDLIEGLAPFMPISRPRYLMGVGKPDDIVLAVERGIDMFDCVLPTRSGRTGQAFTRYGPVNLLNARHRDAADPLEACCKCPACRQFTRAYLHHLVKSKEILGSVLLTWHNLQFYQDLMASIRSSLEAGTFVSFKKRFSGRLFLPDRVRLPDVRKTS